jgi:hypothetical protein
VLLHTLAQFRLQTLALGHLPAVSNVPRWSEIAVNDKPLLASLSRVSELSSLALHNIGWQYAPSGMPHLPQVLQLPIVRYHKS